MKQIGRLIVVVVMSAAMGATAGIPGPGPCRVNPRDGMGWGCGLAEGHGPRTIAGGPALMFLIRHPALAERVGLSTAEVQKLRNIAFEHAKEMIELRAAIERARLDVEKAKSADKPDMAAVEKTIDEVHRIEAQIEKTQYRYQQTARGVISERQLDELWKNMREWRARRGEDRRVRSTSRIRPAVRARRHHGMRQGPSMGRSRDPLPPDMELEDKSDDDVEGM